MTAVNGSETRQALLQRKIGTVGVRGGRWPLHRIFFVAGSVAVPLGLASLIVGYVNVARTVFVFDQLAYVASWGLIGLALVIAGGFLYFGYWIALLLEQGREQRRLIVEQHGEMLERLDRIATAIRGQSDGEVPAVDSDRTIERKLPSPGRRTDRPVGPRR
jgi:hypothetical protein